MVAIVAFSTAIGPVPIDCVLTERHTSELDITEIAIETGSKITDHAVVVPKRLSLDVANADGASSYNSLVAFQESRVPFTIVSGLSVYENMLVKGVYPERDETYSRILKAKVELQQVLIVGTSYAADPDGDNSDRGNAGGKKSTKSAAPDSSRAKDNVTKDRATSTQQRGDAGVKSTPPADRSFMKNLVGG